MATLFARPLMSCALGLSGGAAAYSLLARQQYRGSPLRMDSSPNNSNNNPLSSTFSTYQRDAQTPVVNSHGGLNAKAVRQMTLGSILGEYCTCLPTPA
jgi:tripartite-type tricarboxylate transporter receptor subunit TctC